MNNIYLFSTSSHRDAISINSLSIQFLKPKIDFSNYDYLIITSKQAVNSLKQYDKKEYIDKKALCVSKKTADAYKKIGGAILDIGVGYGDDLADIIKSYPKSKKWLYLRASEVASNFASKCKGSGFYLDEKIVYESGCSEEILDVDISKDAILIFTSPSSIECFLKNHSFDEISNTIVIGKSTAKALPKGINFGIAKETTIESCIDLAKQDLL